jgi:hypothetical protein
VDSTKPSTDYNRIDSNKTGSNDYGRFDSTKLGSSQAAVSGNFSNSKNANLNSSAFKSNQSDHL